MGMLLVGGWIGWGGERGGGVFTGAAPGDKGAKTKMNFNHTKKKTPCAFFLLMSNNGAGRVRSSVRPCLCGKRREQEAI